MRSMLLVLLVVSLCCSCAAGPVYVAKNETESIRTVYDDPQLSKLYIENENLFREIYRRFNNLKVNIYKEGIGLTMLSNVKNEKLRYLMINIRPPEIVFDESSTKQDQRFSRVLTVSYPKYLNYIKKEDLKRDGIEGLELGLYWPVRDYSRCDTYGGFIEYIQML